MTPLVAAAAVAVEGAADSWIQFGILLVALVGGIVAVLWRISDMKSIITGHGVQIETNKEAIEKLSKLGGKVVELQSRCDERHPQRGRARV